MSRLRDRRCLPGPVLSAEARPLLYRGPDCLLGPAPGPVPDPRTWTLHKPPREPRALRGPGVGGGGTRTGPGSPTLQPGQQQAPRGPAEPSRRRHRRHRGRGPSGPPRQLALSSGLQGPQACPRRDGCPSTGPAAHSTPRPAGPRPGTEWGCVSNTDVYLPISGPRAGTVMPAPGREAGWPRLRKGEGGPQDALPRMPGPPGQEAGRPSLAGSWGGSGRNGLRAKAPPGLRPAGDWALGLVHTGPSWRSSWGKVN